MTRARIVINKEMQAPKKSDLNSTPIPVLTAVHPNSGGAMFLFQHGMTSRRSASRVRMVHILFYLHLHVTTTHETTHHTERPKFSGHTSFIYLAQTCSAKHNKKATSATTGR
jgi:hypothetical protein